MSTISVPLSPALEKSLDSLIADGIGSSRADVMRKALTQFVEDAAVLMVLKAESEPTLHGDLDTLAKKFA